jgi:hypothetical protein
METIEERLERLEQDSHPPVNWQEIIFENVNRIEGMEKRINILILLWVFDKIIMILMLLLLK